MKLSHELRLLALAVLLAFVGIAGCKDKGATTAPPRSEAVEPADEKTEPRELTGAELNPNRKGTGEGWRWQGKRDACMFLVGKQCFDKREDACASAGCAGESCVASKAAPAQVSCKAAK